MKLKSYQEFLNENLFGNYSYYGQGSLFPIVSKLAQEGMSPEQIYTYLTSLGIDEERKMAVLSKVFLNEGVDLSAMLKDAEKEKKDETEEKDEKEDEVEKTVDTAEKDKEKSEDEEKSKSEESKDAEDIKIDTLKTVVNDAEKLKKIKDILKESFDLDLEEINESNLLMEIYEYPKLMEALSDAEREKLKPEDFVFPDKRSWPIHDEKRAKTALVWATWPQHKDVKNAVVKAVLKKYPHLKGIGAAK